MCVAASLVVHVSRAVITASVPHLTLPEPVMCRAAFAETLVRQAFAMNVNGVHFDVSAVDMADYDQARATPNQLPHPTPPHPNPTRRRQRVWLG